MVDLTTLNISRTTRAMLMNFCIVNTPSCQILIWVCKVFCLFQQTFACAKVKGNIIKRQKTSALKHFSFPRYFKKWTAQWNHVPSALHESCLENYYIFKILTYHVQMMIYFNKGSSSSRAIFKSMLHVIQNVWHGQGLLIHVTLYNSAYFWVIFWIPNYTLKTGWAWSFKHKNLFQNIQKKANLDLLRKSTCKTC